jgi:hypothetical protein
MINPTTDPVLQRVVAVNPVPNVDVGEELDDGADELMQAILDSRATGSPPVRRQHRKATVAGLGLAAAVALGGAAAAGGLIPHGVTHAFLSVSPPGDTVRDAHMVAEYVTSNGIRVQMWVGHNSSGGPCSYDRTISPDGDHEDGSPGCFDRPPHQPKDPVTFRAGLEPAARPFAPDTSEVVARTTLSRITRISLVYPHRAPYPLSFNRSTGWGLGIAPPSVAHLTGKVVGYDAQGRVVATYRVSPISGLR